MKSKQQATRIVKRNNKKVGYRGLKVYDKAHKLVLETYKITKSFPREELFGLTSQMRRSATSVVANLVEGYARKSKNDKVRFYHIARGSLTELEYYIDLAVELKYLTKKEYKKLVDLRNDTGGLLGGFMRSTSNQ